MTEKKPTAVALGDFDGMHLAHKTVVTGAENVLIYCVNNRFSLLQRDLFEERYPNAVFADFKTIKNMDATSFVEDILIKQFDAKVLLCGYNFRFGKGAMWSALDLRAYLESRGIWVRILEHQDYEGEPISATRIRACLQEGKIALANRMLGYPFTFRSEVLHGDARGRTLGFPTVNQRLPEGLCVPKFGVYESRAEVDGKLYKAFTNIGLRPTYRVETPLCETHIFDYDGSLYGKPVRIELINYLREEKQFSSPEELKKQLTYDKSSII